MSFLSFNLEFLPHFPLSSISRLLLAVCFPHTPPQDTIHRSDIPRCSPATATNMSDDSPASTQAPLTPQSTGSVDVDLSPNGKDKPDPFPWIKQPRQVAFYPNLNSSNKPQKPFSRSAAKRESVMTLGSIEHLQHYFTKTGLTADKE